MTRHWTDGAEFGDVLFLNTNNSCLAVTDQKRSGLYSYDFGQNGYFSMNTNSPLAEFYIRAGYRATTHGSEIPSWYSGAGASGNKLGHIALNSGVAVANVNNVAVATGTIRLGTSEWYLIEVHVVIADSGVIQVKIDGVLDIDYSGDTKPGADATIRSLRFLAPNAASRMMWIDDLALNDTDNSDGKGDNSWVGDGHVILLTPNAAGDITQLYFSGGASNYESVDEFPHDTDTTYVYGSDLDFLDLYNLTPCGLSDATIRRVYAESRSRDTVAEGGEIALTVKTESTEYDSDDQTLLTTYTRIVGEEHVVNPNTSAAWTTTQLDALQVGPKTRLGA